MENGTLATAHETLTKKQVAHSKLVPIESEGLIETSADVHNGNRTNISYSVNITLALSKETQQTLARLYSALPSTDLKVERGSTEMDSEFQNPDTPQPILDLLEAELHPVTERLVLDLKNNSTSGANSDLNVRFRQVFETQDMVLPKWIKHLEVDGVHVTGWEHENYLD